jgi:hypothetical protein
MRAETNLLMYSKVIKNKKPKCSLQIGGKKLNKKHYTGGQDLQFLL